MRLFGIFSIKSMKIIDEHKKNPQTEDWKKATDIFETLL